MDEFGRYDLYGRNKCLDSRASEPRSDGYRRGSGFFANCDFAGRPLNQATRQRGPTFIGKAVQLQRTY